MPRQLLRHSEGLTHRWYKKLPQTSFFIVESAKVHRTGNKMPMTDKEKCDLPPISHVLAHRLTRIFKFSVTTD